MKECIYSVMFTNAEYKKTCLNVSYILLGVYLDASTSLPVPQNKNKTPYMVCLYAISLLFDYGYRKINTIKESMKLTGVKEHWLKNKNSNCVINK